MKNKKIKAKVPVGMCRDSFVSASPGTPIPRSSGAPNATDLGAALDVVLNVCFNGDIRSMDRATMLSLRLTCKDSKSLVDSKVTSVRLQNIRKAEEFTARCNWASLKHVDFLFAERETRGAACMRQFASLDLPRLEFLTWRGVGNQGGELGAIAGASWPCLTTLYLGIYVKEDKEGGWKEGLKPFKKVTWPVQELLISGLGSSRRHFVPSTVDIVGCFSISLRSITLQSCISGEDAWDFAALPLPCVEELIILSDHHLWPWDHMPKGIPDAILSRNWPKLQTLVVDAARFASCDGAALRELVWADALPSLKSFRFNGGSLQDGAYDALFRGLQKTPIEALCMKHGSIHALLSLEHVKMSQLQTLKFLHINGPPESTDAAMTALFSSDLPALTHLEMSLMPTSENLVWYPWKKVLNLRSMPHAPLPVLQSMELAGLSINRKCLEFLGMRALSHLAKFTITQCAAKSGDIRRAIDVMPLGSNPAWVKHTFLSDAEAQ